MPKLWPVAVACALILVAKAPGAARADQVQLWNFAAPGDIAGFASTPGNGATNAVSWAASPTADGGGTLKIDYTDSRGFNNFVSNPTLPPIPATAATISAQVFVPAHVTIQKLELGLQIDGQPGGAADILFHQLDVRGSWSTVAWSIHPGQAGGPGAHSLTFVLSTDDAMPAPIQVRDIRAVTPAITIDATRTSVFDPITTWGQNVAYYYPPAFFQDPSPIKLAQDAGYFFFRIPGGLNSDVYHWNGNGVRKPDGSINPAAKNPDGTWAINYAGYAPGFEAKGEASTGDPLFTGKPSFANLNAYDHTPPVDAAALASWIMNLGPQAQIMVDVNVGTASPLKATGANNSIQESDVAAGALEAAGWVRYYNQQKGLHVKYWEVGNELNPYGAEVGSHVRDNSPQGWHWITAADYATVFRAYAKAMKAVDPTIKIAGPVGYLSAFGDASGQTSWIQTFIQQAGDAVDVIDIHFYNHGDSEAATLAKPQDLQPEIDKMRGWLKQSVPGRADQVAFGVSEWGDYNNQYPVGDALYAADLMGQMAQSQVAFGNAWDIGNVIPDNGQLAASFGFDSAHQQAPGWTTQPAGGASMALSWADDPKLSRPGHMSFAVDYKGSVGRNAALGHDLAGSSIPLSANFLDADVFIPSYPGNNTITLWLRIERNDGTLDDSGRDQPQQPIWGQWSRILLPLDRSRLANARRFDVVVESNIPIVSPLYFDRLDTIQSSYQPNGRYWAAWMYHHYFSNTLVATDLGGASRDRLAAYGSRDASGALYLMVVNKDPNNDLTIPIAINGYTPASSAQAFTWSADNYVWDYSTDTPARDDPPTPKTIGSGPTFTYTFPKYSITAIRLSPG